MSSSGLWAAFTSSVDFAGSDEEAGFLEEVLFLGWKPAGTLAAEAALGAFFFFKSSSVVMAT